MQMLCVRYARQVLTCHFPNGCTLAGYGSACVDQSAYHTPSTSSLPASSTGGIHIAATWPPSAATSPAGLGPAPGFLLHTDSAPGHHAPVSPTDGPRARWHSRSSPSPSSAVDAPPCFGTSSRFALIHPYTTVFPHTAGPTPSPPCLLPVLPAPVPPPAQPVRAYSIGMSNPSPPAHRQVGTYGAPPVRPTQPYVHPGAVGGRPQWDQAGRKTGVSVQVLKPPTNPIAATPPRPAPARPLEANVSVRRGFLGFGFFWVIFGVFFWFRDF